MTTIHQLFEAQVDRAPDRVAIEFEGVTRTYRELDEEANQVANCLRRRIVGPDAVVGLHMGRSLELMAAVLGVLKAGAAYVPLDPQYPAERLRYMAHDAGTQVVVGLSPLTGFDTVLPRHWENEVVQRLDPIADPTHLAYILYTSGSTGRPKGVEVEHHSVVNFIESMTDILSFSEDEVVLSVTGLTFDIAGLDMYVTWSCGARLVLVPRATVFDGALLRAAAEQSQATMLQTTPVTWRMLLDSGWQAPDGFKAICGGEVLPNALFLDFRRQPLRLWNMYGPTETTIWSTAAELQDEPSPGAVTALPLMGTAGAGRTGLSPIHVGRPIANTHIYVLDNGQPVATGESGEVYIGGAGVARGYHCRPELTAQRFVPNPFGPGRLYRTGDDGRLLPDGRLELLGRQDHQIKWHGYRIEPGEVEAAIAEATGIKQSVVLLREVNGVSTIVAWLATDRPWTLQELSDSLQSHLPSYMIPGAVVCLPQLPQTFNGKVDRTALSVPC